MTSGYLFMNACPFIVNMTTDPHVVPQAEHNFLNLGFISTPVSYAIMPLPLNGDVQVI